MFTLKFYAEDGHRVRLHSAESLTVLRSGDTHAEITLHQRSQADDFRVDVLPVSDVTDRPEGWPATYQKVIIENAAGKTTEIIGFVNGPKPL